MRADPTVPSAESGENKARDPARRPCTPARASAAPIRAAGSIPMASLDPVDPFQKHRWIRSKSIAGSVTKAWLRRRGRHPPPGRLDRDSSAQVQEWPLGRDVARAEPAAAPTAVRATLCRGRPMREAGHHEAPRTANAPAGTPRGTVGTVSQCPDSLALVVCSLDLSPRFRSRPAQNHPRPVPTAARVVVRRQGCRRTVEDCVPKAGVEVGLVAPTVEPDKLFECRIKVFFAQSTLNPAARVHDSIDEQAVKRADPKATLKRGSNPPAWVLRVPFHALLLSACHSRGINSERLRLESRNSGRR